MDIWVKMVSFQIIQNVINVKTTLVVTLDENHTHFIATIVQDIVISWHGQNIFAKTTKSDQSVVWSTFEKMRWFLFCPIF